MGPAKILILGAAVIDVVIQIDRLPRPGRISPAFKRE